MNSSNRIVRSWQLFRSSTRVIASHRKLLVFPLITSALSLVLLAFFLLPPLAALLLPQPDHSWLQAFVEKMNAAGQHPASEQPRVLSNAVTVASLGYAAAIYLVSMFAATFCNVAFYNEILKALAGESVSVRAGFAFARRRIKSIFYWSLFAGAVGLVIRGLEERFGWVGKIVLGLIGVVWSVASVFAIPVIIREENSNPLTMLRHSAALLKKTWGEGLVGYVGFALLSWAMLLGSAIFFIGIALLSTQLAQPLMLAVPAAIIWLLVVLAISYVANVASSVYRGALYVYASEGVIPEAYTAEQLDAAWKVKKA